MGAVRVSRMSRHQVTGPRPSEFTRRSENQTRHVMPLSRIQCRRHPRRWRSRGMVVGPGVSGGIDMTTDERVDDRSQQGELDQGAYIGHEPERGAGRQRRSVAGPVGSASMRAPSEIEADDGSAGRANDRAWTASAPIESGAGHRTMESRTETVETTEQLLAALREAQRVVDELRLDAPGRVAAEDRFTTPATPSRIASKSCGRTSYGGSPTAHSGVAQAFRRTLSL